MGRLKEAQNAPPSFEGLKASPEWTLLLEGEHLIVSAGADNLFLADEVAGDQAARVLDAFQGNALHTLPANNPAIARLMERLLSLGAVRRETSPSNPVVPLSFSILPVGSLPPQLTQALAQLIATDARLKAVPSEGGSAVSGLFCSADAAQGHVDVPQLIVLLRVSESLMEAAGRTRDLVTPHVLVDASFNQTLSLGPLVIPGQTACLMCFAGRIRHRWGDPQPPLQPAASAQYALLAGLIVKTLQDYRQQRSLPHLTEQSVSINLSSLETQTDTVFRLPWCPHCYPEGPSEGLGSLPQT